MNELSYRATVLLRTGRGAMQPSMADRARISALLRARLGDAALPLEVGMAALLLPRFAWAKLCVGVAAIGVTSGAVLLAWPPGAPPSSAVPARVLGRVDSAVPAPAVPSPPASKLPKPGFESAAPAARRVGDHLGQEVAILSRATLELEAGRAASALTAVEEHERKFPKGMLVQERRVARSQALRALGRCSEAQPELCDIARSTR